MKKQVHTRTAAAAAAAVVEHRGRRRKKCKIYYDIINDDDDDDDDDDTNGGSLFAPSMHGQVICNIVGLSDHVSTHFEGYYQLDYMSMHWMWAMSTEK